MIIQALRLDAGILVDDHELEILRSIEKIYPQLAEVVSKSSSTFLSILFLLSS